MQTVAVEVELGEGARVAFPAHNEIAGGQGHVLVPAMIGMVIALVATPLLGSVVAFLLALWLGPQVAARYADLYWSGWTLLQIFTGILGWRMGEQIGLKRHYEHYLRGLAARGAPQTIATRFGIADDGLHVETDRVSHVAAWPSVLQVFAGPTHWLVQTDTLTTAIPKRTFATPEEECAFIEALAARMPEASRARSEAALRSLR